MVQPVTASERSETPKGPKVQRLAALVVALVGVAAYAASLGYDFVWDDTLLIQQSCPPAPVG